MSLEPIDPLLSGLEAALAALAPAPGRIDRDALLFRAGQASVPRRRWIWAGATASLAMVALTLGGILAFRPVPDPAERIVYVTIKEPAAPTRSQADPPVANASGSPGEAATGPARQAPMTYLDLERQVLRWDMDGFPESPAAASSSDPLVARDRLVNAPSEPVDFTKLFDFRSFFQ